MDRNRGAVFHTMPKSKSIPKTYGLFAGLDIGTEKVCCAIGRLGYDTTTDNDTTPNTPQIYLAGFGQRAARGIHLRGITDIELLEDSIFNAVYAAEEAAGRNIKEVYVSVPAHFLQTQKIQTHITLSGQTPIQPLHLRKLFSLSHNIPVPDNQYIVHIWPLFYQLDDIEGIQDPIGMVGKELSATCYVVTASRPYIQNLTQCIGHCNLDVAGFVADPYAAGLACLISDEAELGVTLVDVGGLRTQVACFYEGNLVWLGAIPLGSAHITSDLARGLATTASQAERIKTLYGSLGSTYGESAEQVAIPQMSNATEPRVEYVPRQAIEKIIRARADEILDSVITTVSALPTDVNRVVLQKVILTGGAFLLHGFNELAARRFDTRVRIGTQSGILGSESILQSPSISTCAGLLHYASQDYIGNRMQRDQRPLSFWQRVAQWFNVR